MSHLVQKDSLGMLQNCLVGEIEKSPTPRPMAKEVESWAKGVWRLRGGGV